MSLISWLNQHPVFIEEVTLQVEENMKGREIRRLTDEGETPGVIVTFKLLLPIQLEFAECVGLACSIPFTARGLATGTGDCPQRIQKTFTRKGHVRGIVNVSFPSDAWSPDAYLRMYPHIERIVVVESVEFDGG